MGNTNYIKIKDGKVEAQLAVLLYEKDKIWYAYAPALDLVGYGTSRKRAQKSFNIVIEDFFEFGFKRNTLENDLLKHGWVKEKVAEYEVPNIWDVISENTEVNNLTDMEICSYPFTSILAAC